MSDIFDSPIITLEANSRSVNMLKPNSKRKATYAEMLERQRIKAEKDAGFVNMKAEIAALKSQKSSME